MRLQLALGLKRAVRASAVITALLLIPASAYGDQYNSEAREIETPPVRTPTAPVVTAPPTATPMDTSTPGLLAQLKTVTDPTLRALIFRELAAQAAERKDYAAARQYLQEAIRSKGVKPQELALINKQIEDLALASGDFRNQLPLLISRANAPGAKPELAIAVAATYLQQKRTAEAIPWLKKGIAASAKPDPSWNQALLSALLSTNQHSEALPLLEKAVRLSPQKRDLWLRWAAITLKSGNGKRAAAVLALAARQGHLQTVPERLQLISLTAQIGAPFEAGSLLQRWLTAKLIPATEPHYAMLAALWAKAREPGFAVAALTEAQKIAPNNQRLLQIGSLELKRGRFAEAAAVLQQVVAGGTKSGKPHLSLAMARYNQADVEGALAAFKQAAKFADSSGSAKDWITYLESGSARERALAAAQVSQALQETTSIGSGLGSSTVRVQGIEIGSFKAPVIEQAPSAPKPAAVAPVSTASAAKALTPVGAELSGSANGDIPAWTGGLTPDKTPANYQVNELLPDPYPNDKPVLIINASNYSSYGDKLSAGHKNLFKKFPTYTMPVYVTRRSASYPKPIYDASQANMGRAALAGSDALENARLGFPFIQPKSGVEIMWNHRVRYRGDTFDATYTQAVVPVSGKPIYARQNFKTLFKYGNIANPVDIAQKNILVYGVAQLSKAASTPEFVVLFHETANSLKDARGIWVLIVKISKMLRVPPVGYDQPFPNSEGLEFIDMVDMYNGPFDRYVWKLKGKREIYIPYNAYRHGDGSQKYAQLLQSGHINQDKSRYELHRVWIVEASERGGKTHTFGNRTFYIDEDSWNVTLVENTDKQGALWRFQEGHLVHYYNVQATTAAPIISYDLKDGRYFANRLFSEDRPIKFNQPMKESEFLPASVKSRYSH